MPGRAGVDHLPADLDLETADLVLKNEGQEPGIRVQTDTLAVTGIGGRRVADDLEVDVALGQEAVVEVIDRQPSPTARARAVMPTSSIAAIQRSTVGAIVGSAVGHWFGPQSHPRGHLDHVQVVAALVRDQVGHASRNARW